MTKQSKQKAETRFAAVAFTAATFGFALGCFVQDTWHNQEYEFCQSIEEKLQNFLQEPNPQPEKQRNRVLDKLI